MREKGESAGWRIDDVRVRRNAVAAGVAIGRGQRRMTAAVCRRRATASVAFARTRSDPIAPLVLGLAVATAAGAAVGVQRVCRPSAVDDLSPQVRSRVSLLCDRIGGATPTAVFCSPKSTGGAAEAYRWVLCRMPDGGQIRILLNPQRGRVGAVLRTLPTGSAAPAGPRRAAVADPADAIRRARVYLHLLCAPQPDSRPTAQSYVPRTAALPAHWLLHYSATVPAPAGFHTRTVTVCVNASDSGLDYFGGVLAGDSSQ